MNLEDTSKNELEFKRHLEIERASSYSFSEIPKH